MEDGVNEINLQDEIEPEQPAEVIDAEQPVFGDTMSLADQFDAKAKIAIKNILVKKDLEIYQLQLF